MHALVLEVTSAVDNITQSISVLAQGHQEMHNCTIGRFSSTEFSESSELVILMVPFLAFYWNTTFYINFSSFYAFLF